MYLHGEGNKARAKRKADQMSRKDFVAIAAAFKAAGIQLDNKFRGCDDASALPLAKSGLREAIDAFCGVAIDANPRFDRARFLAACGVN